MKKLINILKANQEKIFILGDQALVSGVNFITGIILARTLGLDQYGLFAFVWLLVLFFSSIHQAFIVMPLYTLFPKSENKTTYLAHLMTLQITFSILALLIVFVLTTYLSTFYPDWNLSSLSWPLAAVTSLFVFNDYLRRLFFTLHKSKTTLLMDIIGFGFQPLILILLWNNDALNIQSALITIAGLQLLSSVFGIVVSYRFGMRTKGISKTLKKNWTFSKYLIGTSLLQWVSGNLFLAIGGSILGTSALGAIRIAQNIVGVLNVLFLAMENIVPVRASEIMNSNGRKPMLSYLGKISKQSILPVLLLLGILILFRSNIITLFYGSKFDSIDSLLVAFGGLYVFVFLGTLLRFAIRTLENNKVIFKSYIITTGFSLIMAQPLIVHYQLNGIMIGLFAVQIINISIYFFSLKNELKWLFK